MHFSFAIPFVASRKSGAHSYHSVPAPDEETLLASPESKEILNLTSERSFFLDLSFWLTVFAALSIAVTIRNLLVIQLYSQEPHANYREAYIGNPYNGLEKLLRNKSSPSWPLSSTHYPDFIGATEGQYIHHALSNGSVVRLDSEVCTFIVSMNQSTHHARPYPTAYHHPTAPRSRLRPRALCRQSGIFPSGWKRARAHRTGIWAYWGESLPQFVAFRRHGKQGSTRPIWISNVIALAEAISWQHRP